MEPAGRTQAGRPVEVNVLTDLSYLTAMCNCDAAEHLHDRPERAYLCLSGVLLRRSPEDFIGTLDAGLQIQESSCCGPHSPFCNACDVFSCKRCKFLNKTLTGEIEHPSRIQCRVSHLERAMSMRLQRMLLDQGLIHPANRIEPVPYDDPLELVVSGTRKRRITYVRERVGEVTDSE